MLPAPPARSEAHLRRRTLAFRHSPAERADAPKAVFIHGLGGSSLNWTDLMLLMSGDVDGYAVDLGGFGQSPPPRDGDYSLVGHARAVTEFIDEELGGARVHLFGNSLGGAVAVQVAARRPELVRTLTLISPALPIQKVTKSNAHLPVVAIPGLGEQFIDKYLALPVETRVKNTIDTCFGDASRVAPQRMREAEDEAREREHHTYAGDAFLQSLRGLLRSFLDLGSDRPWQLARRIACPTLAIYGLQDPLVDAKDAHRITKHFRNAHVLVLADSGHVAQMEHADEVYAAWVRFCRSAGDVNSPSTGTSSSTG